MKNRFVHFGAVLATLAFLTLGQVAASADSPIIRYKDGHFWWESPLGGPFLFCADFDSNAGDIIRQQSEASGWAAVGSRAAEFKIVTRTYTNPDDPQEYDETVWWAGTGMIQYEMTCALTVVDGSAEFNADMKRSNVHIRGAMEAQLEDLDDGPIYFQYVGRNQQIVLYDARFIPLGIDFKLHK